MKHIETPTLAADCIILTKKGIVLIERKYPPFGFAIPGGHVDVGETMENAAIREAKEETNLDVTIIGHLGIYDEPNRDPRKHVISSVYFGVSKGEPLAGDDAKETLVVPCVVQSGEYVLGNKLAFDHEIIMRDFFRSSILDTFLSQGGFKSL